MLRAALKGDGGRIRRQRTPIVSCLCLTFPLFLILMGLSVSYAADRPASPAQLQAIQNQIAGLQVQLGAKEAELKAWDGKVADINVKIVNFDAVQGVWGNLPGGTTIGEGVGMGGGKAKLQFELIAAQTQRDAVAQQISSLQQQIAQLQANLSYWKNPLGTELENERAGLRNLENQRPTADDQGQLQWDIENRRRRIQELEEEFRRQQQGGSAGTADPSSGQSAQPQGQSYTTPTQGYGAGGPAGQSPQIGSGGVYGHPGGHGGPPPRVPWDTLVGPSGGGTGTDPKPPGGGGPKPAAGGGSSGGSKGG